MHPLTTDLAQQILALIKIQAYSLLGAIQDNKTVLGGSAGSGGGTGDPPAGFVGQLTQSNVTFDTAGSTRACSAGSAGSSSLVDNLDAIRLGIEICDDAIGDRHIDWGTGAGQVSAVDVPFQSSSGSISATDVREAIEEAWLHGGVTGGSVVGSGVTGQVAYWTTTDTIGGDAGFTYDVATDTVTLAGDIVVDDGSFVGTGGLAERIVFNATSGEIELRGGGVHVDADAGNTSIIVTSTTGNSIVTSQTTVAGEDGRFRAVRKDNDGRAYFLSLDMDNSYSWFAGLVRTSGNVYSIGTSDDFGASSFFRIDSSGYVTILNMRSGATQGAAGANAGELWKTSSHATLPDNVVMIGV